MANILTVSQFVESIRGLLRETLSVVTVQGEVTGFRGARNGTLIYFEIKDESSRVLCFALSHELKVALVDGMEVQVTGSPSLFKGNGGFHIRVVEVQLVGEGALRKQFELTKKRLEAEGLFQIQRKRQLPEFPEVIGIITSPDAAAYTDVLRILKNRWPLVRVQLAGVAVQGPGAAKQIVRAIEKFSETGSADVIILTRGGGSLEDLQAFNDESVARAIFSCSTPVVVGVGHERDETIADYVADQRASTPSNAAERVVPDRGDMLRRLETMSTRQARSLASRIEVERGGIATLVQRLRGTVQQHFFQVDGVVQAFFSSSRQFSAKLRVLRAELNQREALFRQSFDALLQRTEANLVATSDRLRSLSPTAILQRGYSITRTAKGKTVKHSSDVTVNSTIFTTLGSGDIESVVTKLP